MKGGVLEVLLVSAEGLRHPSFFGNTGYYVVMQCGKEMHRSRITPGKGHRAWWNEKFIFQFPFSEFRDSCHLNLRIMAKHLFTDDDFFGQTMIHLEGILSEGPERGSMELKPAPYNIVVEDGSYEGEIKIGLKFIDNVEIEEVELEEAQVEIKQSKSFVTSILNFMRIPWLRFHFLKHHENAPNGPKHL